MLWVLNSSLIANSMAPFKYLNKLDMYSFTQDHPVINFANITRGAYEETCWQMVATVFTQVTRPEGTPSKSRPRASAQPLYLSTDYGLRFSISGEDDSGRWLAR
jgi:hypothetical protein